MKQIIKDILGFGVPYAIRKARTWRLENLLEQELGLKDGQRCNLLKENYLNAVTKLLVLVERRFCRWGRSCNLVGTSLFLPSEWSGTKLEVYRTIWEEHALRVGKLVSNERYHAVRVICNSHKKLLDEVTNKKTECEQFFKWCSRTNFRVRLLFKNYKELVADQDIILKDFMVFNGRFVFGSENNPDNHTITSLMCCKSDGFLKYKNAAKAISKNDNSVEVASVKDLEDQLKLKASWD